MSEILTAPKPYEREHAEIDRVMERLDVVVDILDFKETDAAATAKQDLIAQTDQDDGFDEDNPDHRALLDSYQLEAEAGFSESLEPEPAIGYQLALAALWIRLDDPGRFYDRVDTALDMLYKTHDPVLAEVNAIVEDLESLNTNTQ